MSPSRSADGPLPTPGVPPGGVSRMVDEFSAPDDDDLEDDTDEGAAITSDDEVTARVREALQADAATSAYAERLGIETVDGVVTIRGTVDDTDDSEAVAAVASIVVGVGEVRDETDVS